MTERVIAILKGQGLGAFYEIFPTPYKFERFMGEETFEGRFQEVCQHNRYNVGGMVLRIDVS